MSNFISHDSICGQTLLRIVSRGNAIIAELLRLSSTIPPVFRSHDAKHSNQISEVASKYHGIICDFSYFKNATVFESKIESNPDLRDLDGELCENYLDIINRFYATFESIYRYSLDLNSFIDELNDGLFIESSIETVLQDVNGRQLLCEVYFLLGLMLLVADQNFEGNTREKILVSYYRYSAYKTSSGFNIDNTCNLLRSTGYSSVSKTRPSNYPETFFERANVQKSVVYQLIGCLQSHDIYNQITSVFPHPDHRSVAYAQQSSMLYMILFFVPDILHNHPAKMREIVDKFFPDNWVISVYMGKVVHLGETWESYKAAKQALSNTLDKENVKSLCQNYQSRFVKISDCLNGILRDGWLNEDTVLEQSGKILNSLREANVVLRWMTLHTYWSDEWLLKRSKIIQDQVCNDSPVKLVKSELSRLLQDASQVELQFKETYKRLLDKKSNKLESLKNETLSQVKDLVEVFGGETRGFQHSSVSSLETLFTGIYTKLEKLNLSTRHEAGRHSTVTLIRNLDEAQEFHQIESNLQIKQSVDDVRCNLMLLLRYIALGETTLISLQLVADFSYAWEIMDTCFTRQMQAAIKSDPKQVIKVRATFLKLASAFDVALVRINQAGSRDLVSVSQYYSSQLVSYIREVLQIIPETMFTFVAQIITIQTQTIREPPSRLSRDQLKSYAYLDERHQISELTYKISLFAEGMLMMRNTSLGVIKIDSQELLEYGIRRELVKQVAHSLHEFLVFDQRLSKPGESLMAKLKNVHDIMEGFRRSFEYIQDYVDICGLRIWQEEVSRVIKFNVEQECNAFVRQTVLDWQSVHQSSRAPIPTFESLSPIGSSSLGQHRPLNFIGRIVNECLRVTSPRTTLYDEQMTAWYDIKTCDLVVDVQLFELMIFSIGTAGINGVDQVMCYMIMQELQTVDGIINNGLMASNAKEKRLLYDLISHYKCQVNLIRDDNSTNDPNETKSGQRYATDSSLYTALRNRLGHIAGPLIDSLVKIGQLQIIRINIAYVLSTNCRYKARHLYQCLSTLNESILASFTHTLAQRQRQEIIAATTNNPNQSSPEHQQQPVLGSSSSPAACTGQDICSNYQGSSGVADHSAPQEYSQLLFELTNYLEWVGLSDPRTKVYSANIALSLSPDQLSQPAHTSAPQTARSSSGRSGINLYMGDIIWPKSKGRLSQSEIIDTILMVAILQQAPKYVYSRKVCGLLPRPSRFLEQQLDATVLVYGLTTLIHQLDHGTGLASEQDSGVTVGLVDDVCHYIRAALHATMGRSRSPCDMPIEVANVLVLLSSLTRTALSSTHH
ncbi:WASH complex subunit 5, partial [Fragariocoptes setiger]